MNVHDGPRLGNETGEVVVQEVIASRRPEVFLLPGVFGDEPQLVDLRQRLAGTLDLIVLELPDLGSPGALLASMEATSRVISDEIVRRKPEGGIALIGYSFGASLALAVANDLTRMKRTVAFLGVLDGPFRTDELRDSTALISRAFRPKAAMTSLRHHLVVQVAGKTDATRRLVLAATPKARTGSDKPDAVRRALLTHLRGKALNGWRPQECRARGLLIVTGRLGSGNRAGWMALCPNLSCVDVEEEHDDLLKGSSLDIVAGALSQVLAEPEGVPEAGARPDRSIFDDVAGSSLGPASTLFGDERRSAARHARVDEVVAEQ